MAQEWRLATNGWLGVDMFFVLSGFLLGYLLFQEIHSSGRIQYRRFYWRRALRIYPMLVLINNLTWAVAHFYPFLGANPARCQQQWASYLTVDVFLSKVMRRRRRRDVGLRGEHDGGTCGSG
jgi:peptidoglycan/LPS O-acetylase OafA/YrhL